jgi:hypothetical protein
VSRQLLRVNLESAKEQTVSCVLFPSVDDVNCWYFNRSFDAVMVPLEYCQQCRDAARAASISGIGEKVRDIYYQPQWRLVLKPCRSCVELRTVFLNKIERDYLHRMHLARVSSNLPCMEKCPQHVGDRQVFKPEDMPFEAYWELTKTSLKKFHRQSFESVSAFEICVSNDMYCNGCCTKADDGFEDNKQIFLCGQCIGLRDAFIDRVYHGKIFVPRNLIDWPKEVAFVEEILHIAEFGPDEFRERFVEGKFVSWGLPAADVGPAIAFGLVGAAGAVASIASAVYARQALRAQNGGGDIERGRTLEVAVQAHERHEHELTDLSRPTVSGVNTGPQIHPSVGVGPEQSTSPPTFTFNANPTATSSGSTSRYHINRVTKNEAAATIQPGGPVSRGLLLTSGGPPIPVTVSPVPILPATGELNDDDNSSIQTFVTARQTIGSNSEASCTLHDVNVG